MSLQAQGDVAGFQQDNRTNLAEHLAATASESQIVFVAERACRLKKVDIYPTSAVTGADTNTTHLNLLHNAVEKANYDLTSGNNLTAGTKKALYAPATPLALAAGDVIKIQFEKIGTGLLVPTMQAIAVTDFEP